MSSYRCQEKRVLESHDCVLIYKPETAGDENPTPDSSLLRLTTSMLKVRRLEEISSCHSSNPLEKVAFFQCMEEVEKVKCFLEENASELDLQAGDYEAEENVWSNPASNERTIVPGGKTSAFTERSDQKDQFSSEKEKVTKLNRKNAEKTNTSEVQGSCAVCHREGQDKADFVPSISTELREDAGGKDGPCIESLETQESNILGDKQDTEDKNRCLFYKGGKNGLPSKEDARGTEAEHRVSTAGSGTVLDKHSTENQHIDETNGGPSHERCISNIKAISTPGILGNSASGSPFQNAEQTESAGSSKRRVAEECFLSEDNKKSRIDGVSMEETRPARSLDDRPQDGMTASREKDLAILLDDAPAPAAPFDHRIVMAKHAAVDSLYTVSKSEILGGGRFGQVHKCEEKATGLKLAAKIIKIRGAKDKEDVKNEISVMNQLDHVNLIQLYDAFESKHDIILVMEYVEGGELFDRIIDENCSLTELDTILFMKQICEGIRYMHQMYILHLDLKPENILCVNRDAKQIKIIDFGLARRYKPREKLKVNFGTPEFLAPEVVNYDFVSFPTDMWSVGVITYMLLSGLSPFLGDNDAETLTNILACRWDLEDEEFQDISEEAKEFISKLLIKEKSWRISASEALKHPWLSDHKLHARLSAQNCNSGAQNLTTK
ncbi:myosin light chain kinase family member 4 isoform X2 [Mesocricetus auratus]|uniref:Myosin light chain kinase family member 4 isoform X2 n=1 Tax=Mesocricetus auratus TaxID=10036 RepID=A0ABM2YA66_MESAU|nr:myosin light chain kinase family member 4 isoform X2 [Mesocricetus auratus]